MLGLGNFNLYLTCCIKLRVRILREEFMEANDELLAERAELS